MKKKLILILVFLFFLVNVNAYEINLDVNQIQDVIPKQEFWHWMILNWDYTGPSSGDQNWQTCDFESPDKNYGITLTENKNEYSIQESFGPTTVFDECSPEGSDLRCTAKTSYFFKVKTNSTSQNYTIPVNIRGICGVIETPTEFPVDMNYDYNFTFDSSYETILPDVNVKSWWGKRSSFGSPEIKDAVLKMVSHDPQNKNIIDVEWIVSNDCPDKSSVDTGIYSSDVNSTLNLMCNKPGTQIVVVKATNQDGYSGYSAALTYFSDNNDEVEFDGDYGVLVTLPNSDRLELFWTPEENFDYRLAEISKLKKTVIIKNTGNGFPTEPNNNITRINSTAFTSVLNPDCPLIQYKGGGSAFNGEDFNIIERDYAFFCQPGNHNLKISSTGNYSNGSPYSLIDDFNFVVPDINVHVINMKTTSETLPTYGIIYGEDGRLDLNIVINNYSPEFVGITDVNLYYTENTSNATYYNSNITCTSADINSFSETDTKWKINSYLECTDFHLFNSIIKLSDGSEYIPGGITVFWINTPTDKLKNDSTIMENLYDDIWDPNTGYVCNWKLEDCKAPGAGSSGNQAEGAIILPESQLIVTTGDLIRFYSTVTNVSNKKLGAKIELVIIDSQGNTAATLSQEIVEGLSQGIDPLTKYEFNILFYDTEFLKENELYTVTSTIYWMPAPGFYELDEKPLNNTKLTYFYVIGESAVENLPETNLIGIIIILFSVFVILKK